MSPRRTHARAASLSLFLFLSSCSSSERGSLNTLASAFLAPARSRGRYVDFKHDVDFDGEGGGGGHGGATERAAKDTGAPRKPRDAEAERKLPKSWINALKRLLEANHTASSDI